MHCRVVLPGRRAQATRENGVTSTTMAKKKATQKKSASKARKPNFKDFEKLLGTVEQELERLESGELSLDDSLQAYESGVKALKSCHAILQEAEGKIQLLTNTDPENPELADYDVESGAAVEPDDENDEEESASLF